MPSNGKKQEAVKPPDVVNESQMGVQQYLDYIKTKYEKSIADQAQETAKEIHDKIGQSPEQQWFPFAPMPTDMCRVSPFFPLNRNQLKERPYIRNMVITESSWGQITYSGPKLSVYDEDVLMAILALINAAKNKLEVDGKTTYTYEGSILLIAELMNVSRGKAQYKRIVESIKLMHNASIYLETKKGEWEITSMLIHGKGDKKWNIRVTVNPYFYEMYISGSVTLLDVMQRANIPSVIGKALYRFMQSHRDDQWRGHYITLATALNLDTTKAPNRIREILKRGIKALIDRGHLKKGSGFIQKEIVTLIRTQKINKSHRLK